MGRCCRRRLATPPARQTIRPAPRRRTSRAGPAPEDGRERGLIVSALRAAGGDRSEAARALGVGRATLHEKMAKHGIA
jgi:two-component system response regulator HydG